MNPHQAPSLSPFALLRLCWLQRQLLAQLVRREIAKRYQGSVLGMLWSLLNPVLMLVVYTFVFSTVFKSQWGNMPQSKTEFAMVLFAGLCVYNLFADVVNRSPRLVLDNVSYVKRVVFPLEMLAVVNVTAALFHFAIQVLVVLVARLLLDGQLPWTALMLPLVIFPLLLFSLGISWLVASLGVFLRDTAPVVSLATMALIFLSPVFYSIDALPVEVQHLFYLNPLTSIINQARDVLIWGTGIDWWWLLMHTVVQGAVAWCGYAWFQRTKKGFADVL